MYRLNSNRPSSFQNSGTIETGLSDFHFIIVTVLKNGRGSIVVRAHASRVEGLRFESDSMTRLNARSQFTQQQMGT